MKRNWGETTPHPPPHGAARIETTNGDDPRKVEVMGKFIFLGLGILFLTILIKLVAKAAWFYVKPRTLPNDNRDVVTNQDRSDERAPNQIAGVKKENRQAIVYFISITTVLAVATIILYIYFRDVSMPAKEIEIAVSNIVGDMIPATVKLWAFTGLVCALIAIFLWIEVKATIKYNNIKIAEIINSPSYSAKKSGEDKFSILALKSILQGVALPLAIAILAGLFLGFLEKDSNAKNGEGKTAFVLMNNQSTLLYKSTAYRELPELQHD